MGMAEWVVTADTRTDMVVAIMVKLILFSLHPIHHLILILFPFLTGYAQPAQVHVIPISVVHHSGK